MPAEYDGLADLTGQLTELATAWRHMADNLRKSDAWVACAFDSCADDLVDLVDEFTSVNPPLSAHIPDPGHPQLPCCLD